MSKKPTYEGLEQRVKELEKGAIERKQTEESLREEKEFATSRIDNAPIFFVAIDAQGKTMMMNQRMLKVLGYTADEVVDRDYLSNFVPERDRDMLASIFSKLTEEHEHTFNENHIISRNGKEFLVEWHGTPVFDTRSKLQYFYGLGIDITERKQSEEAMRESEERYRTLFESSRDAIMTLAPPKWLFTSGNPATVQLFRVKDEAEFISLGPWQLSPERQPDGKPSDEKAKEMIETAMRNGSHFFEWTHCHLDGTPFPAEVLLTRMEQRDQVLLQATVRNITDRKQAEGALRISAEKYRRVFENIPTSIMVIDKKGTILDINPFHVNEIGKGLTTKNDYVGNILMEMHPIKNAGLSEKVERVLEGESVDQKEVYFPTTTGGIEGFFNFKGEPIRGPNDEVIGAVIIHDNITDRKLAEEEKEELQSQLIQAQKMEAIGTLAGGIAHDFNNLMMAMLGNVSLILDETEPAHPNHERLKNVEGLIKSGSKLTSQLLGFARKGKYEVKPISLNQIVKESSETFGRTRKEITIHRELTENLSAVEADENQIQQVLLNLYFNAADATPGGGDLFLQTMNVTHTEMQGKAYDPKPGNYAMIKITDKGAGMNENTMARIFEPFFTTKEMGRGTGLGLASAYGIVKGHGGYIEVDSKKDFGTTFSIFLPASDKEIQRTVEISDHIEKGTGTILLVDDEEMVLDVGVQLLEKLGYTVLQSKSGKDAIEIFKENKEKINLVILDMIMPGIGGGEAYDKMKEIEPEVKALLSSGYTIDGKATEILERGCNGFIQKPFSLKELSQKIREILNKD